MEKVCFSLLKTLKKQPTAELLVRHTRPLVQVVYATVALGSGFYALMLFIRDGPSWYFGIKGGTCLFASSVFFFLRKHAGGAHIQVAVTVFAWIVIQGSIPVSFYIQGEVIENYTVGSMLLKIAPGIMGLPAIPLTLLMFTGLCSDGAVYLVSSHIFSTPMDMGLEFWCCILVSTLLSVVLSSQSWRVFEVLEALTAEKKLMESIITIMCDGVVWLSENGGTVVRANPGFDMIVGRDITGEPITNSIAPDEHDRVRAFLMEVRSAPGLLPTTLLTESGSRVPVQMFMVGVSGVVPGRDKDDPAYLVGLRLEMRLGKETHQKAPPLGGLRAGVERALANLQPKPQGQGQAENESNGNDEVFFAATHTGSGTGESSGGFSGTPQTTVSGHIFDSIENEKQLEKQLRGSTEDLSRGLEGVETLGQHEHWLLQAEDLTVAQNEILGVGHFSVVTCGWLHGSPVAVKTTKRSAETMNAQELSSVANEIRVLRHIRHPFVVLFHGACVEPHQMEVVLVLERVQGPDLSSYVARHSGDGDVYKRFQLLLQVACALRYLHAQRPQVIHGDLKDSNILVEEALPRAKLVDFGLSRLLTKGARPLGGTLLWMAPEIICRPTRKPKPCGDIFSFGCVAYNLISCRKPFEGACTPQVIREMALKGITHISMVWQEDRPLHRECKHLCAQTCNLQPNLRPGMDQVHIDVSSWTLPDIDKRLPMLHLAKASETVGLGNLRERLDCQQEGVDQQRQGRGRGQGGGAASLALPLALPNCLRTQESVKQLMLVDIVSRWNFEIHRLTCCTYHGALAEIMRVTEKLGHCKCRKDFRLCTADQCAQCGTLDMEFHDQCMVCGSHQHFPVVNPSPWSGEPLDAANRSYLSL